MNERTIQIDVIGKIEGDSAGVLNTTNTFIEKN